MKGALLLALLLGASAEHGPKQYPVTKVVNLLGDMKKKLEAEAEKDEEVDEKMKCWCKETMQSKEESIASTESQISSLGGSIETAAADSMRLALEVEGHESDLAKSQESLSMAEAQREKQQKTFQEEEKEMKESLTGVDAALDTLQKKSSFLSTSASAAKRAEALDLVKKLQTKHFNLLRAPHQRKLMLSMASAHLDVDANPATGEVVGIMSQMKDTFETNLNQTLKEEAESALTFNGLQEAKTAEIKATQEAILSKKAQHAKADTEGARAKQDLENAQASILVDKQFLADAKEKCAAHEAEFAERVKTRNEEITGCSKAVAILSDDSARDTFGRTFNAGFLQLSSESVPSAASVLARAAAKSQDARLASLAQLVRTGAFDQVKKEIDGLVVQLKEVQQDEVKSKDSCVQRLHENNMDTTKSTNDKAQAESKLAGLKDFVSRTNSSIKTLKEEISALESEVESAKTDMELRQKESAAIVKDQKDTQELLTRALDVLGGVYGASLVQKDEPKTFGSYQKSEGANGVQLLLQQIIGDAKVMQTKAEADLEAAVKDFEQFKTDALAAVAAKEQSLVDLDVEKSQTQSDALGAHKEVTSLTKGLEALGETLAALKEECDFLISKFESRQEAREQEIDALSTAKAILSGMKAL